MFLPHLNVTINHLYSSQIKIQQILKKKVFYYYDEFFIKIMIFYENYYEKLSNLIKET